MAISRLSPDGNLHAHKRQKYTNSPAFWDNLAKIYLSKSALQEHDRRSAALVKPEKISGTFLAVVNTLQNSTETDKNLKRFARHGGPDMSVARGYLAPSKVWTTTTPTSNDEGAMEITKEITKCKSNGPYCPNFEQHLVDYQIYLDTYEYPDGTIPPRPSNWGQINELLRAALKSNVQTTGEDFQKFTKANSAAFKEAQVLSSVMPIIEGPVGEKYLRFTPRNIRFLNLDPLTDGSLVPGSPDIYYGARPEQLDQQVREKLGEFIIPSRQHNLPICPNFFVEIKGPDGSLAVAMRQALYDGALGERGMHYLRTYGQDHSLYDGHASTITSIYHGGVLRMYTVHCAEPVDEKGQPSYFMHQLNAWALIGNEEAYTAAVTAYRALNAWAEAERNKAINNANKVVRNLQAEAGIPDTPQAVCSNKDKVESCSPESALHTTLLAESFETETSSDEVIVMNTNKRRRRQAPGSSPARQTKRPRIRVPSSESDIGTSRNATGLHESREDDDNPDASTQTINSDEDLNTTDRSRITSSARLHQTLFLRKRGTQPKQQTRAG